MGRRFARPAQRFYQVDGVRLKILSVGSMRRKKVASVPKAIHTPRVKYTRTVMRQAFLRSTALGSGLRRFGLRAIGVVQQLGRLE